MSDRAPLPEKARRAVRIALIAAWLSVLLSIPLLIKETAYTFVLFFFAGPTLLLLALGFLGWAIMKELRQKQVL